MRKQKAVPSGSLKPSMTYSKIITEALATAGQLGGDIMNNNHTHNGYSRKEADKNSNLNEAPKKPEWATGTGTENMAAGTSIFDPVLCEVLYRWFCPENGLIVDPFAGGSVRGIVAAYLGFKYIGIDLRSEQIKANIVQALDILKEKQKPIWHIGNSLSIDTICKEIEADFIFSCPPYHDLEVYSDDPEDLSNMSYVEFINQYKLIVKKSIALLKTDRFACFVVADIRDKKGFYKNFVNDTIMAFWNAGAILYNEIILVNVAGSLPIRAAKQFNSGRKVGKMHQNVLVFYKGDPKKIKDNFPKLDLSSITVDKEIE
jgi:hypothetical protein